MTKPITPHDVLASIEIPDWVISAANKCIKDNYKCQFRHSKFTQDELIEYILDESPSEDIDRDMIFDKGWLNIEPIFRNAGWKVTYFKPAYYEPDPPTFTFSIEEEKK